MELYLLLACRTNQTRLTLAVGAVELPRAPSGSRRVRGSSYALARMHESSDPPQVAGSFEPEFQESGGGILMEEPHGVCLSAGPSSAT